ncbi:GTPase, G3E family [Acetitomaculum ruminis DSM 5522]|uniref:GTPase, G3E family n=1 Tax=Acetitomaculum ruminis DSM 5522 TaxID=1120918 RepID=A0A1I0V4N2_9FIRM|nr:GTP-binding protein [Acetitomaculum ruminis]SFA70516.1 GTPase, G3E family [Acetitomaculum ruminis DSM 5522]
MIQTSIFSGFLGAGKTTLIKKLIKEAYVGEKVVLIENEFGEIGIDGGFLKDAGVEITEMNSGCICCSLVGDFGEALLKVSEQFHPDRIVIEPSGVGKLSDVMNAVNNVSQKAGIELTSAVAVVDAKKVKMYLKNFGEFYSDQVEHATAVVFSRTQLLDDKKLKEVVDMLRDLNKEAEFITTNWEDLDGKVILNGIEHKDDLMKEMLEEAIKAHHDHEHHDHNHEHHHHDHDHCDHDHEHHHDHDHCDHDHKHHHDHDHCDHDHEHHHDHHHADDVFTSIGKETTNKYSKEKLKEILEELSKEDNKVGTILRAKGIVASTDGEWLHFDLVPGEYEVRTGSADYTGRICVIGVDIDENKISEIFDLK